MGNEVDRRRRALLLGVVTATVVTVAACAGKRDVNVRRGAVPYMGDSVYVELVNEHFNDARVHAIYDGGHRYTLGLVVGHSKAPLAGIPWQPHPLVLEITFIAAGGPYYTEALLLDPGDVISVRIPPNIATSAFFRRR